MRKRNYLDRVEISKLSENGKLIIENARNHYWQLDILMEPKDGYFFIHLGCSEESYILETFCVNLVSKLLFRERCLIFGVECLEKKDISHMGDYGLPIPTEEYISKIERIYDDYVKIPATTHYYIPKNMLNEFWNGQISVEELINQFAENVIAGCEKWQLDYH